MFQTTNIAARQLGIQHGTTHRGEKEIPLVTMTFEVFLTPALAGEISEFVRSTLYTRSEATANQQLRAVTFDASTPTQRVAVRMAPDQKADSYTLAEVKFGYVHAKRVKETSWKVVFSGTCSPASDHQLAQIVESNKKGRFLTFQQVEPDLFSPAT